MLRTQHLVLLRRLSGGQLRHRLLVSGSQTGHLRLVRLRGLFERACTLRLGLGSGGLLRTRRRIRRELVRRRTRLLLEAGGLFDGRLKLKRSGCNLVLKIGNALLRTALGRRGGSLHRCQFFLQRVARLAQHIQLLCCCARLKSSALRRAIGQ